MVPADGAAADGTGGRAAGSAVADAFGATRSGGDAELAPGGCKATERAKIAAMESPKPLIPIIKSSNGVFSPRFSDFLFCLAGRADPVNWGSCGYYRATLRFPRCQVHLIFLRWAGCCRMKTSGFCLRRSIPACSGRQCSINPTLWPTAIERSNDYLRLSWQANTTTQIASSFQWAPPESNPRIGYLRISSSFKVGCRPTGNWA